jgi:hypothetical protein
MEYIITLEWVYGIPVLIDVLVLLHSLTYTFTETGPFLLVFLVPLLHSFTILLSYFLLLSYHPQIFSQTCALLLFLIDVLIQLMNPLLKIVNLCVQRFLLLLEFFLNFENLYIDHLIFLDFRDKFLLSQSQILSNFLQFFLNLLDLLRIISREEAATEIRRRLLLVH